MANSYTAPTFSIDFSTNVAGLTALKGAPCDGSDAIVITGEAVLTVESALICLSITGDYTITTGTLTIHPNRDAALCALAQVKARGRIDGIGSDAAISDLIPLALRRLNIACGREFLPWVTEARTFDLDSREVALHLCDLRSASEVIIHPELEAVTLVADTDYRIPLSRLTNTGGKIELASTVSLSSAYSAAFGVARIQITGDWGIWEQLSDVASDINEAAIECVLSWIGQSASDLPGLDSMGARGGLPFPSSTFDIPSSAYRKLQDYNRNLGMG